MVAMPTAEIYTLLLAGLLVAGVLWVVARFHRRRLTGPQATSDSHCARPRAERLESVHVR